MALTRLNAFGRRIICNREQSKHHYITHRHVITICPIREETEQCAQYLTRELDVCSIDKSIRLNHVTKVGALTELFHDHMKMPVWNKILLGTAPLPERIR